MSTPWETVDITLDGAGDCDTSVTERAAVPGGYLYRHVLLDDRVRDHNPSIVRAVGLAFVPAPRELELYREALSSITCLLVEGPEVVGTVQSIRDALAVARELREKLKEPS